MTDTAETRISLPERTAKRLASALTAALAAQSVAQAATAEAQHIVAQYQQALAAVAEAHDLAPDSARFDAETGELIVVTAVPQTVQSKEARNGE